MSNSNDEILEIMRRLGKGQPTGNKFLVFDPNSKKLATSKKATKLNPKTKEFEETTADDPDALPEIDPSDAIVF